ncbi:MAG: apolipoprotein N-acyltransferase [Verrucomicrobia bacterium]|jgi:apolipoprotein N-acyltransferase|nr:apolipoprotein N-acyltransferase [Verrucomicrobiota bacterium]
MFASLPCRAFAATLAALKAARLTTGGRYGAAIIAGLGWALAFPRVSIMGLAWLAPALLLLAAVGARTRESLRIGYLAGLTHFLVSLSWLLQIPVRGYPVLGWVALSAFLALFPAVWVMSMTIAARTATHWTSRARWALLGAALWVALEMVQARIWGGFPWNFLGASQYRLLPLIQGASVTGVYGVSFLVVWFSLALFCAGREILLHPTRRYAWLGEIILPATVLALVAGLGLRALREPTDGAESWRVLFVQPSIPQTLIWSPDENQNRFRQLLELTETGLADAPDLVLWPEAAVPNMIRYDESLYRAVTRLAREHRVWMILGCDDAEPRANHTDPDAADYFNAAFLVTPDGELAADYRKNHLVMFGEYLPLARWLPFMRWLTPITGGFTPGTRPASFTLEREPPPASGETTSPNAADAVAEPVRLKVAPLICFEDVFPHGVRRHVEADTDFLVNLTNDGWFGESAAQWQHAASATFRAIENGVPLLRCCNNGLTCWLDARGRWRALFHDETDSVYGPGVFTTTVPRPAAAPATFYRRFGDVFGWSCCAVAALVWRRQIWAAIRRRRHPGLAATG